MSMHLPRRRRLPALIRVLRTLCLITALVVLPAAACMAQDPASAPLSATQQRQVIERLSALLAERYVFADVAERIATVLHADERAGIFRAAADPAAFADALNARLRAVSNDGHLWVMHEPGAFPPPQPQAPDTAAAAAQQRALAAGNYGLPTARILPGNVGYLDVRQFVSPAHGGPTLAAALQFLRNADAFIIDVRESGGGSSRMVALLASYFLDAEPVHLFDVHSRPAARTDQFWSESFLPGPRFVEQPLFILTKASTFSAGEGLAYILKHLGRATIVGETTAGGANPGGFHRVDERFVAFVAEAHVTSAITGSNWEGRGVTPHHQVPAADALEAALELARRGSGR